MVYAHIKNDEGSFVGTIDQVPGGYRITWRERSDDFTGNIHSTEAVTYSTAEEARQGVYRALSGAQIIEA